MLAKVLEKQSAGTATLKGPAFKQLSEEVDRLRVLLTDWDTPAMRASVAAGDPALCARLVNEMLPGVAAVRAIEPRLSKMHAKAVEPDPDLQTYGPVMKDKIIKLYERYLELAALSASIEGHYGEAARCAQEELSAMRDAEQLQRAQEAETAKREEEAAVLQEKAQRAAQRAAEAAEREAVRAAEQARLDAARAKMEEAEERERLAALDARGCKEKATETRWQSDPVLEGDGEHLTMELALALEEQAAARRASLQTACEYVMRQNSPKDAYNAGATVLAYIRAVLAQPRSRDCRRIPVDNAVFHDNVGRLPGGIAVMAALGFEEQEEEESEGEKARGFLVLNRVYVDDLRGAVMMLENGQALLRSSM